jgi:hypothetical protein
VSTRVLKARRAFCRVQALADLLGFAGPGHGEFVERYLRSSKAVFGLDYRNVVRRSFEPHFSVKMPCHVKLSHILFVTP